MAQNVTVAGASYSDVPAVALPKTGGGTAMFLDAASLGNAKVFYGTCSTKNSTAAKVVVCTSFSADDLTAGTVIYVKFTNAQTYNGAPTINVNGTGAVNVKRRGTTNAARYEWNAGETLCFVHDGDYWLIADGADATTTYYGLTKLYTGAASTSEAYALTPKTLNDFAQNVVTGIPVYSSSATYTVGDMVRYATALWSCNTPISTAESWTAAHWTQVDDLLTQLGGKQATLVSGTNIKTINNESLLGSGNISVGGGGVSMSTTTCTLGTSGWSSNSITVTATGVTSSNNVVVAPAPTSAADYAAAGIVCTAQGSNTLTFTRTSANTSAIDVNVLILS